jgi:hypothetical protein
VECRRDCCLYSCILKIGELLQLVRALKERKNGIVVVEGKVREGDESIEIVREPATHGYYGVITGDEESRFRI